MTTSPETPGMTTSPQAPDMTTAPKGPDMSTSPKTPERSTWGRHATLTYLVVCALALVAMLVETLLGHPGTGSMIAAILAAPWSMLVAGLAPPLPRDWPVAAGLAVRMVPLALFMLLNAAIVRGIASRSERDLARTATRASVLLVLSALLGSGCILSSHQEVFVAAPTQSLVFFDGGKQEFYFAFDLTTSPQWLDQRGKIARVGDLAIVGDFHNATGGSGGLPVPIDVKVDLAPDVSPSVSGGADIWGPLHIDTSSTKRIGWSEGERLMLADAPTLQTEIRGDGKFRLYTVTVPQISLNGGVSIENLRLMAVFELK